MFEKGEYLFIYIYLLYFQFLFYMANISSLALQVDEEPAIRTNTTILLGNIASYLNEGVSISNFPFLLVLISHILNKTNVCACVCVCVT